MGSCFVLFNGFRLLYKQLIYCHVSIVREKYSSCSNIYYSVFEKYRTMFQFLMNGGGKEVVGYNSCQIIIGHSKHLPKIGHMQ